MFKRRVGKSKKGVGKMPNELMIQENIKSKIYTIRNQQVMLDRDLAEFYGVTTKRLNEQVKRNSTKFPNDFMFQLTKEEFESLRSQFATSNRGGRRYLPYVFTEQGVASLSGVLNNQQSDLVYVQIMRAFVAMRKLIASNSQIFQRLTRIEYKQVEHDKKFEYVLKELEGRSDIPKQGIFFNGQIYDAYKFAIDLIKKAKKSIVLIDNYIDDSVFTMLDQRNKNVTANIFTKEINKKLSLSLEKHNQQYVPIKIYETNNFHDRFFIMDNNEIYHIGASLKDLGKKCFAFSKMESKELILLIKDLQLEE